MQFSIKLAKLQAGKPASGTGQYQFPVSYGGVLIHPGVEGVKMHRLLVLYIKIALPDDIHISEH